MPLRKPGNASKPSGDNIDVTLDAARSLLNVGGDLLSLAPIPGLKLAASALANVIGTIQDMRKNAEDMEKVANRVKELADCLKAVYKQAKQSNVSVADVKPLEDRIKRLEGRLKDVENKAKKMKSRSRRQRFLRKKIDAEELDDLEKDLAHAIEDFKLEGDIAVEGFVGVIQEGVVAIQKVQLDDHDRGILERLPYARAASYRSVIHESKSGYLDGTREALLEEIDEWAKGTSSTLHHRIYVLSGAAGTGKSTIACELAKRLARDGILGASFFFDRGYNDLATTRRIFTTFAYQLASFQPTTTRGIVHAASSYLAKGSDPQRMEYGLKDLIIEPLSKLPESHAPIILIIDALDECTDSAQELIPKMLHLLADGVSTIRFPLRIFITSRPDYHIENAVDSEKFGKDRNLFKLQDVPRATVGQDIKKYLQDRLSQSAQGEELQRKRPNAIAELAKKADGLFIFASTAINFLNQYPVDAVQRLDILLADNMHDTHQDLSDLDQLYTLVLQNAFGQKIVSDAERMRKVRLVLGTIALLQDQLTVNAMALLISLRVADINFVVQLLASVVLRDADDTIRPLHASFPQFLIDSSRCKDTTFYIDPEIHHAHLAISCLSVLTQHDSLRRNICCLPNPAKMKHSVKDLPYLVSQNVPTHVQYACIHWAFHVSSTQAADSETRMLVVKHLDSFLMNRLLVWYEALSLMNRLEVAPAALLMVRSWYQRSEQTAGNVGPLLDDGYRFVLEYFDAINACPEHIYISALPTMPSCKLLDVYEASSVQSNGLRIATLRDSSWSPCIRVIEGISDLVSALAYSPNGRWIVAGTRYGTVCSWDAGSGIPLNMMATDAKVRHSKVVWQIDVSPDNSRILSGDEEDIRIWNLASGALLHVITEGKERYFRTASFSLDGKLILAHAYARDERSIRAWDSCTFAQLPESSNTANYYPHSASSFWGAMVLSITSTNSISIYDLEHKAIRSSLVGHSNDVESALFFPGEGSKVVSFDSSQVRIWDVPSARCLHTFNASGTFSEPAISSGGHRIAVSSRSTIDIWDAGTGKHLAQLRDVDDPLCLCFSPQGDRLLSFHSDGIHVWDLSNTDAIGLSSSMPDRSDIHRAPEVSQVILSDDEELAASAATDSTLNIWRIRSGTSISTITLNQHHVYHMIFSPNGRHLAVIWGADDYKTGTLVIYEVESGQSLITTKVAHEWIFIIMQYSSSGNRLAICNMTPGMKSYLDLYDASGLSLVKSIDLSKFTDKRVAVKTIAFSPDDNNVYVRTIDGLSFLWDCHSGESLPTAELGWIKHRGSHPASRELQLKDGWVVDGTGQKMCWITASKRPTSPRKCFAYHGHTVVIGGTAGKVTIIDLSEVGPQS
ncbi:WD40 repeat-like protein [Laetiporus sulphureus 93-53]|uniref:WD40 repeat-like protein n=1 Tax=Laetiporus sulphureus 93-53 TaxID=1314785 RepID=A0A165DMP0_9APHY|nr:WD40 repeat-like protein [Laetiporus sulphureus 93-53]KZT05212.1 WD40 repeat-like protein [Laetiporus sulphureus 93-53]